MEKLHIAIVGRRNNGKSSLINTLTGQKVAIVSDIPGTTTDPVKRSFEIPGFASVVFIDTAGIDDTGELGTQRTLRTQAILPEIDIALLVISANQFGNPEENLITEFTTRNIPYLILHNKSDLSPLEPELKKELEEKYKVPVLDFSTLNRTQVHSLLDAIGKIKKVQPPVSLLGDLIRKNDIVILVTPVDSEVPVGRLILPQVQTIRSILDQHCISIVLQPEEIENFLATTSIRPRLVITDSQVFQKVSDILPSDIPLTSFSILLARHKGYFEAYVKGTTHITNLRDHDTILMLESCSHHVTCEDIGRIKIPRLLQKYTGKKLNFEFIAGLDPIEKSPSDYAIVIQCGGCMITGQQLQNRLRPFIQAGIPVSNYGMTLAFLTGIFTRTLQALEIKP